MPSSAPIRQWNSPAFPKTARMKHRRIVKIHHN
jgi:hypothetical protein